MLLNYYMKKPKAFLYFSDIASSVAYWTLFNKRSNKQKKDIKGHRWMPWLVEAMKDVLGCEKPRGAAKEL